MTNYWVIRTDKKFTDFLWAELQNGRLRQGWGYDPSQDLRLLSEKRARDEELSPDEKVCWRGNRRLLDSEPDGLRIGDVILAPHLPRHGEWSIARVAGSYSFDIAPEHGDYGHVLPVELLTKKRSINPFEGAVSAKLRQTMRNPSRMWQISKLGSEIKAIVDLAQTSEPPDTSINRLGQILTGLEDSAWKSIQHHYKGAEFEKPCITLLKSLYGEENVNHTGGSNERGADAICQSFDPLGIRHAVAVQIKMWDGKADLTHPLDQIHQAYDSYPGITSAVIFCTSENISEGSEKECEKLAQELGISIKVFLRQDILRLFIAHLPNFLEIS